MEEGRVKDMHSEWQEKQKQIYSAMVPAKAEPQAQGSGYI